MSGRIKDRYEGKESDWELDPEFEKRDALPKAGIPVEIARTDRLLIRETIDSDIPELYRIGKDQAVRKYIAPMQPTLEEEIVYTKAYVRHMYAFYDFGLWTVLEKDAYGQERVIGRAGLFPSERLAGQIEMGYMIAPECQGNGYGKEAAKAVRAMHSTCWIWKKCISLWRKKTKLL